MDSQIAMVTQSLTEAEETRNQTKLIMQLYANCKEYLTPAPLSIAILGELVFMSSQTDFSINKNPPKNGYEYIKHPDSFRACLMQVCNSGWGAFNEAHKNMDQIRLHTMTVPDYMKSAEKILFQGNDEVVQAHLPDQLKNIRVIADNFVALAGSTEKHFTDVINVIGELLEACVNAKHFYGEELEEIKKKLEENKIRKQSSEEAVERSEKRAKDTEEAIKEAQEIYKAAMDSLPSGWSMVAMELVEAVTENLSSIVAGLAFVVPVMKICSAKAFDSKSKDVTKPEKFKEQSKSVSERASDNARFRIGESRAQLKETKETYGKSEENMEKYQKELTEILISMRNCEVKEIDFHTTIQMLVKVMDAMGRMKEQWEKMLCFFKMVSNIVKTSLASLTTSEKTQSPSYDSNQFPKDLLYNQAFQASNIASLVHMISATYTDISEKYLIHQVSSLGKLMTMDKEKPEFEQERLQLQNSCVEAQEGILHLVLNNKEEFERKINKQLLPILPEAAPEEMKSIQATVESGFTEEEEEGYA